MTRAEAVETLGEIARGIREGSEDEAVARLLERVAVRDEGALQAALLEVGARTLLHRPT